MVKARRSSQDPGTRGTRVDRKPLPERSPTGEATAAAWPAWAAAAAFVASSLGALHGQVVNPADAQRPPSEEPATTEEPVRLRSWEMPAITVVGEPASELREEDRIGSYGQPRWTATRRFPGTRVYVVPEGKMEFEFWLRPTIPDEGPTEIRTLWELEFGLPYRFQLDFYFRTDQEGDESEMLIGQQVELRWALADWGNIFGNPTLYLEWVALEQRPDKIEPKLLFGDEIAPRWHWGVNLVAEIELGGEQEHEYQLTGGLSYTVIDSKFAVGAEVIGMIADVDGNRGDFSDSDAVYIGPSVQWKPARQATLNLAPLFGVTSDSADARIFINFGWEF
jgi:hypothetical protein